MPFYLGLSQIWGEIFLEAKKAKWIRDARRKKKDLPKRQAKIPVEQEGGD